MFISPKTAIEKGWVQFPTWMTEAEQAECIQPNALDFTVDHLQQIDIVSQLTIGRNKKDTNHRRSQPVPVNDGWWNIHLGPYDLTSDFYVNLPDEVAALVIIRSTFNRNGLFVTTGLWDSGFKGNIAGVLHNQCGEAKIEQHVRVGQIIFVQSDKASELYKGGYNTANGQHWSQVV